jgi:hypothetical protein
VARLGRSGLRHWSNNHGGWRRDHHLSTRGQAGTVEFLLDERGNYVFIEMNPRIQVEHTVTEEITDVDLVSSQLRIPAGETLADLTLSQEAIVSRGAALQCRITTEDPVNGFRPDAGRIAVHRSPGGAGIRLDGGAQVGAEVSAHFDSMLVKLTCRGRDFATAVRRRPAFGGGVPNPRCVDKHSVPAGGARRPGFPGGPSAHGVHRRTPGAADCSLKRRPRHQDRQLSGRCDGEQAARGVAVDGVSV